MELVSVIYDISIQKDVEHFIELNQDVILDSIGVEASDDPEELLDYIYNSDSEYYFIPEAGWIWEDSFLQKLQEEMLDNPEAGITVCVYGAADPAGKVFARAYREFAGGIDRYYNGIALWAYYERYHVNIIGGSSCCLLRRDILSRCSGDELLRLIRERSFADKKDIFYKLFTGIKVHINNTISVARIVRSASETELKESYNNFFFTGEKQALSRGQIARRITFFFTDKGEYYNVLPIADEAERRGYEVSFTQDLKEKAEIGVYCQHVCYPDNFKFSVILLHDMAQGHNRWPNLWLQEPWHIFDIGVLPGEFWADLWKECGELYYANPRYGVYQLGYPKSDIAYSDEVKERAKDIRLSMDFKYNKTILYAPSWENDRKEDDFVKALVGLPVNLLIKQAHCSPAYAHIMRNIEEMRALHEGKYDNLYYIEPEESIMTALSLCDLVVSDESSVMT